MWPLGILVLLIVASSLSGAPSPAFTAASQASAVAVEAIPVDLDDRRPERTSFGSLQLLTAVQLSSKDGRFGGISGLAFGTDGRMYAVSDRGYWLSASLSIDADGTLLQLNDWQIAPLLGTTKSAVQGSLRDAEALARTKDGSFLVGFEGAHRVWRYAAPPATLASAATPVSSPAAIGRAPRNGGIEAIAEFADERLVILTEDFRNADGSLVGWIQESGRWAAFSYLPARGFNVTDAAALPDGDLLVLERRFAFFAILSTRVTLVPRADIRPGARLSGKELLRLESPLTVENFEGIAVRQSPKGITLFLISDDNYSPFQQTLLLQFLLPSAAPLTTHAAP